MSILYTYPVYDNTMQLNILQIHQMRKKYLNKQASQLCNILLSLLYALIMLMQKRIKYEKVVRKFLQTHICVSCVYVLAWSVQMKFALLCNQNQFSLI